MSKEFKLILLFGVLIFGLVIAAVLLSFLFLGGSGKSTSIVSESQKLFTKSDELRFASSVNKFFEGFKYESPFFSYNSLINKDILRGVKDKGIESLVVSSSRKRKDYSVFVYCRMEDEKTFYGSFYLGEKGGILASISYEDIEITDEKTIKMFFDFTLEVLEEARKDVRYVSLVEEGPYIQVLEKIKKHMKK